MNSSSFDTVTFESSADKAIIDNLIKYAIAPRPICFASTIDTAGNVNLSPFSYFNLMSHQPPICVFSPLRRMRDGSTKHTLDNIQEVNEVVINIVNYAMVQQQSLASTEYGKEVNEFDKSGFTPIPSLHVRPPRVAESPVQLECRERSDRPERRTRRRKSRYCRNTLYACTQRTLTQKQYDKTRGTRSGRPSRR
ncbi:flavin reductase family protein [Sphingobacterium sp. E70]|uniref:flavin reductase family protein n=1 Tax=Sphingobacterium sp. E70 TaxID=2853439 RepID=UPI00211C7AD8|nr:flavin reductase family protein [Sphingobacterium sp. E70]ULT26374.1 flavin reductase family protein [Sphingobacterium sp. E70]